MKSLSRITCAAVCLVGIAAGLLTGCSMPVRLLFFNNTQQSVEIDLSDQRLTTVAANDHTEFRFDQFFRDGTIAINGVKHRYAWPRLPDDLLEKSKYPPKFAVALGDDGKIYALKLLQSGETQQLTKQPDGFPLSPIARFEPRR